MSGTYAPLAAFDSLLRRVNPSLVTLVKGPWIEEKIQTSSSKSSHVAPDENLVKLGADIIFSLYKFTSLRSLALHGSCFTSDVLAPDFICRFTNLSELDLSRIRVYKETTPTTILASLPNLTKLDMSENFVCGGGGENNRVDRHWQCPAITNVRSLKHLAIRSVPYRGDSVEDILSKLEHLPQLEYFDFSFCFTAQAKMSNLTHLTNLHTLKIQSSNGSGSFRPTQPDR